MRDKNNSGQYGIKVRCPNHGWWSRRPWRRRCFCGVVFGDCGSLNIIVNVDISSTTIVGSDGSDVVASGSSVNIIAGSSGSLVLGGDAVGGNGVYTIAGIGSGGVFGVGSSFTTVGSGSRVFVSPFL